MKITNSIQNCEINKEKQHQAELHCYWAGPIISAAHHSAWPASDSCSRTRLLTERAPLVSETRSRGATVTAELVAGGSAGETETTVMLTA
jgi:hypothetical protein